MKSFTKKGVSGVQERMYEALSAFEDALAEDDQDVIILEANKLLGEADDFSSKMVNLGGISPAEKAALDKLSKSLLSKCSRIVYWCTEYDMDEEPRCFLAMDQLVKKVRAQVDAILVVLVPKAEEKPGFHGKGPE